MRHLLLFSVLLLGASWMAAQSSTGTGQDQGGGQGTTSGQGAGQGSSTGQGSAGGSSGGYGQSSQGQSGAGQMGGGSGQKTVTGCLSQANGQYMLTSRKGMTYQLSGDTSSLANHVGHEVKVTGTESGAGASANAGGNGMGQSSANGPMLEISSVKHISKTCSNNTVNSNGSGGAGSMSH